MTVKTKQQTSATVKAVILTNDKYDSVVKSYAYNKVKSLFEN